MSFVEYNRRMIPARDQFSKVVSSLKVSKQFVSNFCWLGVQMTAQVPDWMKRAGQNCIVMKLHHLGHELVASSCEEDGHHIDFESDVKSIGVPPSVSRSIGVNTYRFLHEAVIDYIPYAQIAIQTEIENLSLKFGPLILASYPELSFVRNHISLDVEHCAHNQEMLAKFLSEHPEFLERLVFAGSMALLAYGQYLVDSQ